MVVAAVACDLLGVVETARAVAERVVLNQYTRFKAYDS